MLLLQSGAEVRRKNSCALKTSVPARKKMVEAPGIEPGSEKAYNLADPCSVDELFGMTAAHRHTSVHPSPAKSYAPPRGRTARVAR